MWLVWSPDGTRTTFAPTMRVNAGSTYAWGLSEVRDTLENSVAYKWWCDAGACYPKAATYAGTYAGVINLYYEQRPDVYTFSDGLDLREVRYRLKSIDVLVNQDRIRAYAIHYGLSTDTSRSSMRRVEIYGRDAVVNSDGRVFGEPLFVPSFDYSVNGGHLRIWTSSTKYADLPGWTPHAEALDDSYPSQLVDLNGDGLTDLLVSLQTASGRTSEAWMNNGTGWDRNDAYAHVVGGSGSDQLPSIADIECDGGDNGVRFADLNGDGLLDILQSYIGRDSSIGIGGVPCGPSLAVASTGDQSALSVSAAWLNTGAGFQFAPEFAPPTYFRDTHAAADGTGTWDTGLRVIDLNGDGRDDLIQLYFGKRAESPTFSTEARRAWINRGGSSPWVRADEWVSLLQLPYFAHFVDDQLGGYDGGLRAVDLNGDGLSDLVQGYRGTWDGQNVEFRDAWLNTGKGFRAAAGFIPSAYFRDSAVSVWDTGLRIGDLNGDGRIDLVLSRVDYVSGTPVGQRAFWANSGTSWRSESLSWAEAIPFFVWDVPEEYETNAILCDLDGNGRLDWVRSDRSGISSFYVHAEQPSDLLVSVDNSIGATYRVAYTPSTRWPVSHFPGVIHTVASMTRTLAPMYEHAAQTSVTTYHYEGANYDGTHFLGFGKVWRYLPCVESDAESCPFVLTTYLQKPGIGSYPIASSLMSGSGVELATREVALEGVSSAAPYRVQPGRETLSVYDEASGEFIQTARDFVYDAFGNVTLSTDHGFADRLGDETTTRSTYVPNLEAFITGKLARVTTFNGTTNAGTVLFDTKYRYDNASSDLVPPVVGLPTARLVWHDHTGDYLAHEFAYDRFGNVVSETGPEGATKWSRVFDSTGVFVDEARDALYASDNRHAQLFTWDRVCGKPRLVGTPDRRTTEIQYDEYCRPIRIEGVLATTTSIDYIDATSFPGRSVRVRQTAADASEEYWTRTYYDGVGRPYWVAAYRPYASPADTIYRMWWYDERDRTVVSSRPHYSSEILEGDVAPYLVRTFFDKQNRPTRIEDARGASVRAWTYGLDSIEMTTADGTFTEWFNANGQVTATRELFTRDFVVYEPQDVEYEYDARGNLRTISDGVGNEWWFDFDSVGLLHWEWDPNAGARSYEYLPSGQLASSTDGRGQHTEYEFDALGRLRAKRLGAESTEQVEVSWNYDEPRTGYYNVGGVTSMIDGHGRSMYNYDVAGRLVHRSRTVDNVVYAFEYGYDAMGRRSWIKYPDGDYVGTPSNPIGYDRLGRLTTVPDIITNIMHAADGQIEQVTYADGSVDERTYARETGLWIDWRTSLGAQILWSETIVPGGRTAQGRIGTIVHHDGQNVGYDYSMGQLLRSTTSGVQGGSSEDWYGLDELGNLSSNPESGVACAYPAPGQPRPHAPMSVDGLPVQYDESGNTIANGQHVLAWGPDNAPSQIDDVTLRYDGDGNLLGVADAAGETLLLGDDFEVRGCETRKYVRLNGLSVARRVGQQQAAFGQVWLHADHLGSTVAISDTTGLVAQTSYNPFGKQPTPWDAGEPVGFLGQRAVTDGIVMFGARPYDVEMGRFLAPARALPGRGRRGLNGYALTGNNPVNDASVAAASVPPASANLFHVPMSLSAGAGFGGLSAPTAAGDPSRLAMMRLERQQSRPFEWYQAPYGEQVAIQSGGRYSAEYAVAHNVTGGLIGPDDGALAQFLETTVGWIPPVRTHAEVHDAAGYLYTYKGVGPGYEYAPGIWREPVGGILNFVSKRSVGVSPFFLGQHDGLPYQVSVYALVAGKVVPLDAYWGHSFLWGLGASTIDLAFTPVVNVVDSVTHPIEFLKSLPLSPLRWF
ncbi:MAG: toxin TcdB middle/N-terminal domain-containing protein [Myxococcota bacterium]